MFKTEKYCIVYFSRSLATGAKVFSVTVSQLLIGKGEPHFSSHLDTRTEAEYWVMKRIITHPRAQLKCATFTRKLHTHESQQRILKNLNKVWILKKEDIYDEMFRKNND